jgi:hypothetical protein
MALRGFATETLPSGRRRVFGRRSRAVVEALRLGDAVQFASGLDHAEVAALMASAGVAVVPSLYEGFSLPAIEAMACGTALVATRAGVARGRRRRWHRRAAGGLGRRGRARHRHRAACRGSATQGHGWERPAPGESRSGSRGVPSPNRSASTTPASPATRPNHLHRRRSVIVRLTSGGGGAEGPGPRCHTRVTVASYRWGYRRGFRRIRRSRHDQSAVGGTRTRDRRIMRGIQEAA